MTTPTAILVGCVAGKLDRPAAARHLYTSPLWRKRWAHCEALAVQLRVPRITHPVRGLQIGQLLAWYTARA